MHLLVYEYTKQPFIVDKELSTPVEQILKYLQHGAVSNHLVVSDTL